MNVIGWVIVINGDTQIRYPIISLLEIQGTVSALKMRTEASWCAGNVILGVILVDRCLSFGRLVRQNTFLLLVA